MFIYDKSMADTTNDVFLNNSPRETKEVDEAPENYNVDDFGNHIYDCDWVFIGYAKVGDKKPKFVASQEGFLAVLDEYRPENILLNELDIISGKEWLGARWMEEQEERENNGINRRSKNQNHI